MSTFISIRCNLRYGLIIFNQVLLNFAEKSVIFSNSENLLKSPTNSKSEPSSNEIQGYLLLSSMEIKEEVELKNIAVVQNFPKVFSNYIPTQ